MKPRLDLRIERVESDGFERWTDAIRDESREYFVTPVGRGTRPHGRSCGGGGSCGGCGGGGSCGGSCSCPSIAIGDR